MAENKMISINSLELLESISKNDSPKTVVIRKVDNLDIAYGTGLNRLDNFFISVSMIKKLEKQLTDFKKNIDETVLKFTATEQINPNDYMLKTEADRKKSELITYEKLDEILKDYIKNDELEQSIYECEEHAYACANSMYTSLVNPAAVVRSFKANNNAIAGINVSSDSSDSSDSSGS
jgi:hypothetical protein